MADTQAEISCLILGEEVPFRIEIARSKTVGALKDMIKEKRMNQLFDIDAYELKLYKVKIADDNQLVENVKKTALGALGAPLKVSKRLAAIFDDTLKVDTVYILVEPPNCAGLHEPSLTFQLPSVESYFDLQYAGALKLNNISPLTGETPSFIPDFQNALESKRFIPSHGISLAFLQETLGDQFGSFFSIEGEALDPVTTEDEILHHLVVLKTGTLHDKDAFTQGMEAHIRALLYHLGTLVRRDPMPGELRYNTSWPFSLVVDPTDSDDRRTYTPRSDVDLRFSDFTHLILEVISNRDKSDCIRMLLEASCLARFGNRLRKSTNDKPLIASAIYIDNNMQAEWYQVYQRTRRELRFNLRQPLEAFKFVFQLYNFVHRVRFDSSNLEDPRSKVQQVVAEIGARCHPRITTRERETEDDGDDSWESSNSWKSQDTDTESQDNVFKSPSVVAPLAAAGYHITPDPGPGWAVLDPIGPSMHQAKSSDGKYVFLKLLKRSKELEILQYLGAIQSAKNHTVTLLNHLALDVGTMIALPWQSPLHTVLRYNRFPLAVRSLRTQFLEGVAFMHQHGIAHRDLKPDNVVVQGEHQSTSPHLSIVDFDVSKHVTGVETVLEGRCGTYGWMAPEVQEDEGSYSPILADRWACGKMIRHFSDFMSGGGDGGMAMFASRLLRADPASRPALSEVITPTTPGHNIRKRPAVDVPLDYHEPQKRRL